MRSMKTRSLLSEQKAVSSDFIINSAGVPGQREMQSREEG
jgi:hypothetical protein